MTKQQALDLVATRWWEERGPADIVAFQLFEELLCMPWEEFHGAVQQVLGRDVFIHEFGWGIDQLRGEFLKEREPATLDQVLALIPPEKLLIAELPETR